MLLAEAFLLASSPLCADTAQTDVIVTVTPPDGADPYAYSLECAEALAERLPDCEYGYIYDTLLCGFSLELPKTAIGALTVYGFVEDVYASADYTALSYDETKMLAAETVGVTEEITGGLTGDGVKVAVIDSGFDVTHPAFNVSVTETLDLSKYAMQIGVSIRLNALRYVLDVQKFRYNSKIPFMFDYADRDANVLDDTNTHGTHVAGIIGAAKTVTDPMHGIAPDCQLLLMKVFSNGAATASDSALIAALEDAVKLGADVINLSIGHYAGSTDMTTLGLDSVINKARESGCIIVCAAGNEGVTTDRALTELPLASYTDYGTVSAPASSNGTVAVASVDNAVKYGEHFRHAKNGSLTFRFTDTNAAAGTLEGTFNEHFNNKTLEYSVIPGIGEESDYNGIDITGKLALIQRGTTTFVEKVNTAASHGAVGAIIYNNVKDEYISMELTGATLPAISISLEDGETLISQEVKKLTFSSDFMYIDQSETAGKISQFSSRGTTPSLTLKPDISAVGGSVYSTVNGGGYAGVSGTSMASPQFAGMCALLIEKSRIEGTECDIETALMNSAVPVTQKNGVEFSPRAQGAGLIELSSALGREIELTYTKNGKAKAELFDKLCETFTIDVTVKNLTNAPLVVSLGATLTSDGFTEITADDKSEYYSTLEAVADTGAIITSDGSGNLNRYCDDYSPLSLTLDSGEARIVTLNFTPDAEYREVLADIFTNGFFAEGYIYCDTENSSVSLPYMGYIGDFTAAPVLDGDAYSSETGMFDATKFMIEFEGIFIPTGANVFTKPYTYDRDTIAFSPNGDDRADALYFAATQLRNVKSAVLSVRDSDGEILYTRREGRITKTYGIDKPVIFYFSWDGGDGMHGAYRFPDGDYTFEVVYTLDYGENSTQTYSYDVKLDTAPPTVTEISYTDGKLTIRADDASGISCLCIYEGNPQDKTKYMETDGDAVFDVSDIKSDTFYYEIIDGAYNVVVGKLSLSALAGKEQ